MKKVLLAFLILIFCAPTAYSFQLIHGRPSAGASYLFDNGFEGTGDEGIWTTGAGTPDYDATTTPMTGSEYLSLDAGESVTAGFTATSEVWGTFQFRFDDNFENTEYVFYPMTGVVSVALMQLNMSQRLQGKASGGSYDFGSTTLTAGTTYDIKWYYKKGTGSNAIFTVWLGVGGSWNQEFSSTDGTGTSDVDGVKFRNAADTEIVDIDKVLVDDVDSFTSP